MRPHTVRKKGNRKRLYYYSCRSGYNTGPSRDCANRKYMLAAKGHMAEEELGMALAALDEIRETAEREFDAPRREVLKSLQHDRDTVLESYAVMANEVLENLAPEERHRPYKLLRLNVYSRPDWPLEIKGIFANIEDELQTTVCRAANSRHLAYKGAMARTTLEGTTSGVR